MNRKPLHRPRRSSAAGFGLVELMVGLVIGMIAVIVMMQVFSVSEGWKRTSTGSADAQNNGAIALYGMQRELRQGGHGANAWHLIGCNVQLRAGVTIDAMSPATINHPGIPAGDANSDTLLVMHSNTNGSPEGDKIETQTSQKMYAVSTPASFAKDDFVIAALQTRPAPCDLVMEQVTDVAAPNVTVGTGVLGMGGGILFNLGRAPSVLAYAVRGGNLTVCDYRTNDCSIDGDKDKPAVWVPIASGVVALRAQYGRDTTAPTHDATVDYFDQTTPASACEWTRVSALRLALVARNMQYDKEAVTAAAPTWSSSVAAARNAALPIDLGAVADWQHYRYRVFETTIPLRNMAWMGGRAGC